MEGPPAASVSLAGGRSAVGRGGLLAQTRPGGLLLGTARETTGLVYSGKVKRKWNEEKTSRAMFMDKMQ